MWKTYDNTANDFASLADRLAAINNIPKSQYSLGVVGGIRGRSGSCRSRASGGREGASVRVVTFSTFRSRFFRSGGGVTLASTTAHASTDHPVFKPSAPIFNPITFMVTAEYNLCKSQQRVDSQQGGPAIDLHVKGKHTRKKHASASRRREGQELWQYCAQIPRDQTGDL